MTATTTVAYPAMSLEPYSPVMSRPQVGIDRLPANRRPSNNEPKEAMNCKSCRKRKIKCNRIKPSCEACQIFNCACVYDAVPKKRGPKTDVLEALLKRVSGLEKRLRDENKTSTSNASDPAPAEGTATAPASDEAVPDDQPIDTSTSEPQSQSHTESNPPPASNHVSSVSDDGQMPIGEHSSAVPYQPLAPESLMLTAGLMDTFFARLHGKPFYILDEPATRQRLVDGHLPNFVLHSIFAVAARYAPNLCGGTSGAVQFSQDCAQQARREIDVDEPSVERLQALLLLSLAAFQVGRGRQSFMLLSHAVSIALALNLHRELPQQMRVSSTEREGRRKLFWTCYAMDRFMSVGSRRPSLIADEVISLRLPSWRPRGSHSWIEGSHFSNGPAVPFATTGASNASHGSGAMLVDIVRILGLTNRYLAGGGVKGDSHFPWHAQSTLSRIRADLDYWAAHTHDVFSSIDALFDQPDTTTLVVSKLIYHLIHCLLYRPFLPVDLAELSGTSQHQSWQIDATNLCFLHANAVAELVEIGRSRANIDWPPFVGYCLCTAGTVLVHGAHYATTTHDADVFGGSAVFLSRVLARLNELQHTWLGVRHQRDTLQSVYVFHSELVKSLASNPMRFSPVFQMEDFFDRYPGAAFDGAFATFTDVPVDELHLESPSSYGGMDNGHEPSSAVACAMPMATADSTMPPPTQFMTQDQFSHGRPAKRRRVTNGGPREYPTPDSHLSSTSITRRRLSSIDHRSQLSANGTAAGESFLMSSITSHPAPALPPPSMATLSQSALSPTFSFGSPNMQPLLMRHASHDTSAIIDSDPSMLLANGDYDHQTPDGMSAGSESAYTDGDKDPFLMLLEQLAQNDGTLDSTTPGVEFFLQDRMGSGTVGYENGVS